MTREEIMQVFKEAEKAFCTVREGQCDCCGRGMHGYLKHLFEERLKDEE